jgi:hypothetical protein
MHKHLVALLLLAAFSPFLLVSIQTTYADTCCGVIYSSGVHLYSPLNTTYPTNALTLNLTYDMGIQSHLNYSVDGKYGGEIPLHVANASEVHIIMTKMAAEVALPSLADGSHCLTINVEANLNDYRGANPPGAPFHATNEEGTNWQAAWTHTIYFTIKTAASSDVPTAMPPPTEITTPTSTAQPPATEPQQNTPLTAVLIIALVAVYISVLFVVAKNPKKHGS